MSEKSKAELYKLYNKAIKMLPGSEPHKKIMARISELRDELGMNEEEISEAPMTRPNNNPNFIPGIGVGKTHNQTLPSASARTAMNNQSGYATPVYPTAPGQSFNPPQNNKQYMTPIRPTNAQKGPAPQRNYSNSELDAMFNSSKNTKKPMNEEISKFDPENPMSSEVLIQGYGTMSIKTLMKNVMGDVDKLAGLRDSDPQSYRNLQHSLYKNGVFRAKLNALVGALDELQEIKSMGGKRSRNIQKEAEEQQPQEETMPIDIQQVLRFVDDMEDRQQFQPEYADKLRRAISSLASARKTLSPEILLQVMTLLTQGRR